MRKIVNAAGMKESWLENFHFMDVSITGKTAGDISFARHWQFSKVSMDGSDGKKLNVVNAENMELGNN